MTTDIHIYTPGSELPEDRRSYRNYAEVEQLMSIYLFPPVALSLMCSAVIPSSLQRWATSWAANMAAYGEDSSLSAFTFIPPVTRQIVSLETHTH